MNKLPKERCARCKKWVSENQLVLNPFDENNSENGVCTKCEKIMIEIKIKESE